MKKKLFAVMIVFGMMSSMQTYAATQSGIGCNKWGIVNYTYVAEDVLFAVIGGGACIISGTANQTTVAAAGAILSEAQTSGKQVVLSAASGKLYVAMEQ